jgi:hypothetical protein
MLSVCSRDDTLGVEAQPMFECVAPGKMYRNIGLAPTTMPHILVKEFI